MHEPLKVSLWDAFTYFLSGSAFLVGAACHLFCVGKVDSLEELNGATVASTGVAIVCAMICGLVIEPIANFLQKLVNGSVHRIRIWIAWIRSLVGRRQVVVNSTKSISCIASEYIPEEVRDSLSNFHWCRDWLTQRNIETSHMAYLSKFGFYRNMAFLFLLNAGVIGFCYEGSVEKWLCIVGSLVMWVFCHLRSSNFYWHMGQAVYGNFLVAVLCEDESQTKEALVRD